jgi:PAS domain S-box-containing protein
MISAPWRQNPMVRTAEGETGMNSWNSLRQTRRAVAVAFVLIVAAAALRLWPLQALGSRLAWLTFYPAAMIAALLGGIVAGLVGTLLSCLAVIFLLPNVVGQPLLQDTADWVGLAVFALTCSGVSLVAEAMHRARERERKIERERDRFFDLVTDPLCIAGFDGFFKRLNPAWEKTLGFTREELMARPYLEFVHPEDRDRTAAEAVRLGDGQEAILFENRYLRKDGSYCRLVWNAVSLTNEGLIFATARDVTARREAEAKIVQLNAELQRRSDQLETSNKELEAFCYSVSHDLRAPLRHIDGFSSLLHKHAAEGLDDKGRRYLEVIAGAARQMGQLIDDLLSFSRMSRVTMRLAPVDQQALVATVMRTGRYEQSHPGIEWHVTPLPWAHADEDMLRLVWANLIDNAVKYSGKTARPRIEIGGRNGGGETVFFVRDNGAGFDPRYAAKLFGVFQRLHSAAEFEGTGIGLANVRRIINRHGGRTWADGVVGQGATFYFSLPKADPAAAPAARLT